MHGEKSVGWCIRYTGTRSCDTGYSPCKLRQVAGLCGGGTDADCGWAFRIARHRIYWAMPALRAVGFTVDLRIPTRGFNDVYLMKRKFPCREPLAKQDEAALTATFRARDEALRWKLCDCLANRAATRTRESDIDTWAQHALWRRGLAEIIGRCSFK